MQKVLTAEQMRTVDRLTTERCGISAMQLMLNAGTAAAKIITEKFGGSVESRNILVLCGKGNNGGDGAVVARALWAGGANVCAVLFANVDETTGDTRDNFEALRGLMSNQVKGMIFHENPHGIVLPSMEIFDIVVDAMFGTGLNRPVEKPMFDTLMHLSKLFYQEKRPYFVSLDIPSGLDADNGILGALFDADLTVTFTAPKPANVLPPASNHCGELIVADIGSPVEILDEQPSRVYLTEKEDAEVWLKKTEFSSSDYKNRRGHALLIAGSESYSGAAVLAGNAAMRSGVGLVTLAVPAAIRSEVAARALPDLIVRAFDDGGEVDFNADSILIGCGLDGNNQANEAMFRKIVEERTTPVIVDAGALGFFADRNVGVNERADSGDSTLVHTRVSALILTPHEGEFLRLLGAHDKFAINDRVAAVREYAVANNVILVLKGERVLIGAPDGRVVVNPTGNSGLGKAGNGDTLAGILAGLVAQAVKFEIDIFETVVAAVYVAGMAGDIAEKKYGKRVMTASDVRECLVDVFEELKGN